MKVYALLVSTLAIGLSVPAMAQQSMHRYIAFFKYSDTAVKAMTENPQEIKLAYDPHSTPSESSSTTCSYTEA